MHYTVQYATRETFFLLQKRVARRLTSELVVSVMDQLSGNNIPSDSNDERLDDGDGERENDELDQLSTIYCNFSLIAWCAQ